MKRPLFFILAFAATAAILLAGEKKKELTREEKLVRIAVLEDERKANDELFAFLSDDDLTVAARAACACGRIGNPVAAGHLSALLERITPVDYGIGGRHAKIAETEAVFALGQFGEACPVDVAARYLRSDSPVLRALAVESLGKAGMNGIKHLDEMMKSAMIGSRSRVAAMTYYLGRREIPLAMMRMQMDIDAQHDNSTAVLDAVPKILPLASDNNSEVRWKLAYALQFLPHADAKGVLMKMLKDSDTNVRAFAALACKHYNTPDVKKALLAALEDKEWLVKVNVITTLENFPEEDVVKQLLFLLRDKNFHIRQRTARVLGNMKAEDARDGLGKCLIDECPAVRAEAAVALGHILGEKGIGAVRVLLGDKSHIALMGLARACGIINTNESIAFLRKVWDASKDPRVKTAVLQAAINSKSVDNEVHRLAKAGLLVDDVVVRYFALIILGEADRIWAYEHMKGMYGELGSRDNDRLRLLIVSYIKKRIEKEPGKEDAAFLGKALKDPAYGVRKLATDALRIMDGRKREIAPDTDKVSRLVPGKDFSFEPGKHPRVQISTPRGKMVIELFSGDAPMHVARFLELVRKKFYDGLVWHRVENNWVIQGGCPEGSGRGSADFNLRLEINRRRQAVFLIQPWTLDLRPFLTGPFDGIEV
jgi:HEAT repeat protein